MTDVVRSNFSRSGTVLLIYWTLFSDDVKTFVGIIMKMMGGIDNPAGQRHREGL